MDTSDRYLKAEHIEIELNDQPASINLASTPKLKLYNTLNLPQKIQLWILVFVSFGSFVSILLSISSSLGLYLNAPSNMTFQG